MRICLLIRDKSFPYYQELILAVQRAVLVSKNTLEVIQLEGKYDLNAYVNHDVWLLISPRRLISEIPKKAPPIIFLQGEPGHRKLFKEFSLPWIHHSKLVLELMENAFDITSSVCKNTKKLFVGYDPAFRFGLQEKTWMDRKFDVGLIGSASPRRDYIVEQIRKAGLRVWDTKNLLWGIERNKKIIDTKLMLSISYDDNLHYASPRMEAVYLSNAVIVLSESVSSKSHTSLEPNKHFFTTNYDIIVEEAIRIVSNSIKPLSGETACKYLQSLPYFGDRVLKEIDGFFKYYF